MAGFFYGSLPPELQSSYQHDPRRLLAQQLLDNGTSQTPLRGGATEGVLRLANALVGGYQQNKVSSDYAQKGQDYNALLANALRQVKPGHFEPGANGGDPTYVPQDISGLEGTLSASGNPLAAGLIQKLRTAQIEKGFDTDATIAAAQVKAAADAQQYIRQQQFTNSLPPTAYQQAQIDATNAQNASNNALRQATLANTAAYQQSSLDIARQNADSSRIRANSQEPAVYIDSNGVARYAQPGENVGGRQAPTRAGQGGTGRLPASALKLQNDELGLLGVAANINANLTSLQQQITEGKLKLGPVENAISSGRNKLNISTPNSRAYNSFNATIQRLRNDSLRLNKGTQTEGDAQRAWDEIGANPNDQQLVHDRLGEIARYNESAAAEHESNVRVIRENFNAPEMDFTPYTNKTPNVGANVDKKPIPQGSTPDSLRANAAAAIKAQPAARAAILQSLGEFGVDASGL